MGVVDIPWPLTSNPGAAPGEGSGRLINCFAYKDGAGPRWRPVPGLVDFASVPSAEPRGALFEHGQLIAVFGSKVVQVDSLGNVTAFEGSLPGSGPVTISQNNNSPTSDVVIATSNGAFVVSGGVVNVYPDGDLPQANDVAFLDGYFLFTTSAGQMWASGLNSTSIDPLSFANAESRPDGLLRGIVYGQQYFAMGADTIEVWQDVGSLNFPLQRSAVIPIGLYGQWAIAGFESGWGGPLIFVAQDGSVRTLDGGYTPTRISNEDIERLIAAVTDRTALRAAVYTFGGNAIWSLSSDSWTWEYNVTTGEWHERMSYGNSRWRGAFTVNAFGSWVVADVAGARLYTLSATARKESTDPVVWGMDSGPVKNFPIRIQLPGAAFDFVLGQAEIGDDPQVMLSWSHDGGMKWANPVQRSLGKMGLSNGRVTLNRIGLTSPAGVRFRFRVSDPVYSSFAGARLDAVGRR